MKLLVMSRYGSLGSSSRLRMYQYLPFLNENGVETAVFPLFNDAYLKTLYKYNKRRIEDVLRAYLKRCLDMLHTCRFDLIWIEKELFPWMPPWIEYCLERIGIPYIADYDDATFHNYDCHPHPLIKNLLKHKIDKVMKHAELVTAGNEYLAERAVSAGADRVEILPTVLDAGRYSAPDDNCFHDSGNVLETKLTIGWIGSPSTAPYLRIVEPALLALNRLLPFRLLLVGSGPADFPGIDCSVKDWSEDTEAADIQSFDIGIMPLPDTLWAHGKCGYKLIQYMACSLPVIASPIGVNNNIVENGVNGFLASSADEWADAIDTLSRDKTKRRSMGRAGRLKVEARYSLQYAAPELLKIMKSVLEKN